MPTGVYKRTEKHRSINKGRKYPNRKSYKRGWTDIPKVCLFCKKDFVTNCIMPNKKYCSMTCRSKANVHISMYALSKVDREKQRQVVSNRKGELHPNWIKDRSKLKDDSKDRKGQLHREWSISVKKRDSYVCKMKNESCSGRLESHHIFSWKDYPELRYRIDNGITLCHFHHPRRREDEESLAPFFVDLLTKL